MRTITHDGKGNVISDVNTNTLEQEKAERIAEYKALASEALLAEVPVFKQINAALSVYAAEQNAAIKAAIVATRTKVDEFEAAINACKTLEETYLIGGFTND